MPPRPDRTALLGLALALVVAVVVVLMLGPGRRARAIEARPADPEHAGSTDASLAAPEPRAASRSLQQAGVAREPREEPVPRARAGSQDVVRVLVVSARDQRPLAGAEVLAFLLRGRPQQLARGTTGEDGTVDLSLGPLDLSRVGRFAARLDLRATAAGHLPGKLNLRLDRVSGEGPAERLELEPGLALRGRVLHPGGAPAAGALATLLSRDAVDDDTWLQASVPTDDHGEFTLAIGDRRPESLRASLDGLTSDTLSLDGWDLGARRDVGDLVLRPGMAITGRVDCMDGDPAPGVTVIAKAVVRSQSTGVSFNTSDGWAETGIDGTFAFEGLTEDEYHVFLQCRDEESALRVRAGDSGIELNLPGSVLRVLVRDESGQELQGIEVAGSLGDYLRNGEFWTQEYVRESTQADGAATFLLRSGLQADVALLRVELWDDHQLERSFDLAGGCAETLMFEVPDELPTGWIELAPAGVEAGEPCQLALRSPLDGSNLYRVEARVGDRVEVLEGSYLAELELGERASTCLMPVELALRIRRGESIVLDRAPVVGGRLTVEVRGGDGEATCRVARVERGEERSLWFQTEPRRRSKRLPLGRACLASEVLPPGVQTLRIEGPDQRSVTRTVTIAPGETMALVVDLGPGRR